MPILRLKELRKKQNLTQDQLSELSGVSQATIQYVETGNRNPSLLIARRLAEALNVKIEELFNPNIDTPDRKAVNE